MRKECECTQDGFFKLSDDDIFRYEVRVNAWMYSLFTAVRFWNEKCDHDNFKFAASFFVKAVVYCV